MKFRSFIAAAALAVSGVANAAIDLGTDPSNDVVAGAVIAGGPSFSTYTFDLTSLSDLAGSFTELGFINVNKVTLSSGGSVLYSLNPITNSFLFEDLVAGSYSLTFRSVGAFGAFVGTVTSTSVVPEPESYALALAGLAAIGMLARRRQVL